MGELSALDATPEGLDTILVWGLPMGKKQVLTMPKTENETLTYSLAFTALIRVSIAYTYALGSQMMVPWDVYDPGRTDPGARYYGNGSQFADIYQFVRAHASLLDETVHSSGTLPRNSTGQYKLAHSGGAHGGDNRRWQWPYPFTPPSAKRARIGGARGAIGEGLHACEAMCDRDPYCKGIYFNNVNYSWGPSTVCYALHSLVESDTTLTGNSYVRQQSSYTEDDTSVAPPPVAVSSDPQIHVRTRRSADNAAVAVHLVNWRGANNVWGSGVVPGLLQPITVNLSNAMFRPRGGCGAINVTLHQVGRAANSTVKVACVKDNVTVLSLPAPDPWAIVEVRPVETSQSAVLKSDDQGDEGALPGKSSDNEAAPPSPPHRRAAAMLARMTRAEKIGLMGGCDDKGKPDCLRPETSVGLTRAVPHLGIPSLHLEDGPQGVGDFAIGVTMWPSALTVASSFDADLIREYGAAQGREFREKGMSVMLGPGVNLARVPQNGRNYEYYSEDPWLAAHLAKAEVEGIQSEGVIACMKHFIFYTQEGPRRSDGSGCGATCLNTIVGKRALHELYLQPFEGAIAGGAQSAMCSYNKVNGTASCGNAATLQLLENELNFSGFVVTDWDDLGESEQAHSFEAGLDITMSGAVSQEALTQLSNATIDQAAGRILTAMYSVGLFDRQDYGNWTRNVTSAAHYKLAQSIAEQSTVLLVNKAASASPLAEGKRHTAVAALPLDPAVKRRYAVIGSNAGVHGVGSGSAGQGDRVINSAEGIARRLTAMCGTSSSTVSNWTINWQQPAGHCIGNSCIMPVTQADIDAAVSLASGADIAIVELSVVSGEGVDRQDLSLGNGAAVDMQSKLVAAVAAVNNFTIVVLRASGAVAPMPFLELPAVRALVLQFLPGSQAGLALASILFGDINPSGKLPLSFPRSLNQTWLKNYPCDDQKSKCSMCNLQSGGCELGHCSADKCDQPCVCDVTYSEGLEIGYRWFDSYQQSPLFEFGFGMSFTTFDYSGLSANRSVVAFSVRNNGTRFGVETAQLYLGFPAGTGEPPKQLRGVAKIKLAVGETKQVTLLLSKRDLSIWSEQVNDWIVVTDDLEIEVLVGSSSRDIRLHGALNPRVPAMKTDEETDLQMSSNTLKLTAGSLSISVGQRGGVESVQVLGKELLCTPPGQVKLISATIAGSVVNATDLSMTGADLTATFGTSGVIVRSRVTSANGFLVLTVVSVDHATGANVTGLSIGNLLVKAPMLASSIAAAYSTSASVMLMPANVSVDVEARQHSDKCVLLQSHSYAVSGMLQTIAFWGGGGGVEGLQNAVQRAANCLHTSERYM